MDARPSLQLALDGVFTAAQDERGKSHFASGRCAECHRPDLSGDRGPALKGDAFLAHWENGSIHSLFDKIRETMPATGPTEVTDEAKADIGAYLLQSNGFPAGKTELRAEADTLGAEPDLTADARRELPGPLTATAGHCTAFGGREAGLHPVTHSQIPQQFLIVGSSGLEHRA